MQNEASIKTISGETQTDTWMKKTSKIKTLVPDICLRFCNSYWSLFLACRKRLEVELIPLELMLKAWASIMWIFHVEKTLWQWKAPAISGTIWEKEYKKNDLGPPRFPYCDRVTEQWYVVYV